MFFYLIYKDITILLTVYNRPNLQKMVRYANEIKLPFKIFMADGGNDNQVRSILKRIIIKIFKLLTIN